MKKISKKEAEKIFNQCFRLIEKKEDDFFSIKRLRGCLGLCDWEKIEMDYRKEFIETTLHECVHYIYPDWSETQVLYVESRIMNCVEPKKIMKFGMCLCGRIYDILNKNKKPKSLISRGLKKQK